MRPEWMKDCTIECERRPRCEECGRTKAPVGRSVPMASANGYCTSSCAGYDLDPKPGHLWPGELREYDEPPQEGAQDDGK